MEYTGYNKTEINREESTLQLVFSLTGGEGFVAGGFASAVHGEGHAPTGKYAEYRLVKEYQGTTATTATVTIEALTNAFLEMAYTAGFDLGSVQFANLVNRATEIDKSEALRGEPGIGVIQLPLPL